MLKELLPKYYKGIYEFEILAEVEGDLLEGLRQSLDLEIANQFVITANEEGLERYEKLLGIIADGTLEERRQTILAKLNRKGAYNMAFLRSWLDAFLEGDYFIWQDIELAQIIIFTKETTRGRLKNLNKFLQLIIPLNQVFMVANILEHYTDCDLNIAAGLQYGKVWDLNARRATGMLTWHNSIPPMGGVVQLGKVDGPGQIFANNSIPPMGGIMSIDED